MRTVLRVVFAVAVLGDMTACAMQSTLSKLTNDADPPELKADRASLQGQGYSAGYIDGHVDGCASGYKSAGNIDYSFYKDTPQQNGADYLQGWNIGFALCKGRYEDYATHATPPVKKE
jgi:hypothetical protein